MKNNTNIGVVNGNNNNFNQTINQGGGQGQSSDDSTSHTFVLLIGLFALMLVIVMFYLVYFDQIMFFLKFFVGLSVVLFVFKIIYPLINRQQDFQDLTDSIIGLFLAGLLAVMVHMTDKAMPQQILILAEELSLESGSVWNQAWLLWTQFKPLGHKIILCNMGATLSLMIGIFSNLLYSFNLFKPLSPLIVVVMSLAAYSVLALT
ncbi:hypothetical protein ACNQO6_13770 [Acinetobacter calcoaceticus]|uniref:hypothetical protein n=1 Tax=Acinetobacter calcoaceticus TaxID=471 RepID=UPI002B2ADA2E|nr:hypothetical protein SB581_03665 [Acinetobacter baumannii]